MCRVVLVFATGSAGLEELELQKGIPLEAPALLKPGAAQ